MKKFDNNDQMKAFLKKEARRLNISVTNAYNTFVARSILERISKFNDHNIVIKGSSAEIAYLGKLARAITDIDIATLNNIKDSMYLINAAINDNNNDSFNFKVTKEPAPTNTGIYKMKLEAKFEKIRKTVGIDIQDNYNRLIEPTLKVMPPIFESDTEFEMFVPSFEEYLAEKMCIIVESNRPDILNTRVKDFYDIYELHGGKYNPDKLTHYFREMLKLRGKIDISDAKTVTLNREFIDKHNELWNNSRAKYDFIDKEIGLEGAVYYARAVIREQLQKSGQEMADIINNNHKLILKK